MEIGILSPTIPTVSFALVSIHLHLDLQLLHVLGTGSRYTRYLYANDSCYNLWPAWQRQQQFPNNCLCAIFAVAVAVAIFAQCEWKFCKRFKLLIYPSMHLTHLRHDVKSYPYPQLSSGSSWPELKCNTSESIHAIAISIQKLPAISSSHCCLSSVFFLRL